MGKTLSVQFAPANQENFGILQGGHPDGFLETLRGQDPFMGPIRVACDDDVGALGERSADGFEGFAPHEYGVAARQGLEAFEVLRQMPKKPISPANEEILVVRNNEGQHTVNLNGYSPRNVRMRIIALQTHIVVREVKQGIHVRIQPKGRKCARLPADLKFDLVEVVAVYVGVA